MLSSKDLAVCVAYPRTRITLTAGEPQAYEGYHKTPLQENPVCHYYKLAFWCNTLIPSSKAFQVVYNDHSSPDLLLPDY
jgi:hypothetical protein